MKPRIRVGGKHALSRPGSASPYVARTHYAHYALQHACAAGAFRDLGGRPAADRWLPPLLLLLLLLLLRDSCRKIADSVESYSSERWTGTFCSSLSADLDSRSGYVGWVRRRRRKEEEEWMGRMFFLLFNIRAIEWTWIGRRGIFSILFLEKTPRIFVAIRFIYFCKYIISWIQ